MESPAEGAQKVYHQLWQNSAPLLRQGRNEVDPLLAKRAADDRRGISVMATPDVAVQRSVMEFTTALGRVDANQYFYQPAQLHITVLSLFTATTEFAPFDARWPEYGATVERALVGTPEFEVVFQGVTASSGAVLIQGFPVGDTLERTRERLRSELRNSGLAGGLDARYRIVTAHMTAVRFRAPLCAPGAFCDILSAHRTTPFGRTRFSRLSLVKHDWYVSPESKEVLITFQLRPSAGRVTP